MNEAFFVGYMEKCAVVYTSVREVFSAQRRVLQRRHYSRIVGKASTQDIRIPGIKMRVEVDHTDLTKVLEG